MKPAMSFLSRLSVGCLAADSDADSASVYVAPSGSLRSPPLHDTPTLCTQHVRSFFIRAFVRVNAVRCGSCVVATASLAVASNKLTTSTILAHQHAVCPT